MIVVSGVSGQLGHAIVERLLERVPANDIGVSVRDPEKVADFSARGVRVRRGDFADPESLRPAFEGASQVLLVSSNVGAFGGDPVAQHQTAIAAAREAGAHRILYTSHQSASPTSRFGPARHHAATEALLAASPVPFVSLRNGFYYNSVKYILADAAKTGQMNVPPGGKASWTAPADLAEAAAIILSSPDGKRMEGPITLTASEAIDLDEIAEIAGVRHQTISDDEYVAGAVARGTPENLARMFLTMFAAMHAGEFDVVDPTLEKLLGRKPLTVRSLITP